MPRSALAAGLRRLALVFVVAWAARTFIVTGDAILNEHLGHVLRTSPAVTQVQSADSFTQSLIKAGRALDPKTPVVVYWNNPPDYWYAFFWSTYWLFPRTVTVATTLDESVSRAEAVLAVRGPHEPPAQLPNFTASSVDSYPDLVVTTYRRP